MLFNSLINLMYHRVTCENLETHSEIYPEIYPEISQIAVDPRFVRHLEVLAKNYCVKIPQEKIKGKKNLCLSFDDATADFYFCVYPLLKKLKIKVVLAVPAGLIQEENNNLSPQERMKLKDIRTPGALCTWSELQEMASSGFVKIASHGMTHRSLRDPEVNLDFEILESKKLLENKLNLKIDTFVYPYGQYTSASKKILTEHYLNIMRVGYAVNFSWRNLQYRVKADEYWKNNRFPKIGFLLIFKRIIGFLRGL